MTTIAALLQEPQIFALLIIVLTIMLVNQYLWHRRQMRIIEKRDFIQPGAEPPSQLLQVIGISLVVASIGVGGIIEALLLTEAGGGVIFAIAGGAAFFTSLGLYCAARKKGNDDCDNS